MSQKKYSSTRAWWKQPHSSQQVTQSSGCFPLYGLKCADAGGAPAAAMRKNFAPIPIAASIQSGKGFESALETAGFFLAAPSTAASHEDLAARSGVPSSVRPSRG